MSQERLLSLPPSSTRIKVVRFEVECEDGRVFEAVGDTADEIWKAYSSAMLMEQTRGRAYTGPRFTLKQSSPSGPERHSPSRL
jgi:hypothetical protein